MNESQEFGFGYDFRPTLGEDRSSAKRAKRWGGGSGYFEDNTRSRKHASYEAAECSSPADSIPLSNRGKIAEGPIFEESISNQLWREPLGKPPTDAAALASIGILKNAANTIPYASSYAPKESGFIQIDGADGIRRPVPRRMVPKPGASQTTDSSHMIAGEALKNLDFQVLLDGCGPSKSFCLGPVGAPGSSRFFPSDASSGKDDHASRSSITTAEEPAVCHASISTLDLDGDNAKDENINLPAQEKRPGGDLRGPGISEEAVPFTDQLPPWLDEALRISTTVLHQASRRRAAIEASGAIMECLDSAEHLERVSSMTVFELGELVGRAREEWTRHSCLSGIPFDKIKADASLRLLAYTNGWAEEMRGLYSSQDSGAVPTPDGHLNQRPLAPVDPFREQYDEVSHLNSVREAVRQLRATYT